jgi:riboflavin biosynthesis pyrimidine reductase
MKRISLKGIPKQHQSAVRAYMAVQTGMKGKQLSPQQAYKSLQDQWKAEEEKRQREQQEREAHFAEQSREWAKKSVRESVRKLAYLRDFLRRGTSDNTGADIVETSILARALLVEAGSELEQALFNLGIVEGMKSTVKGRREGWIKEFLK